MCSLLLVPWLGTQQVHRILIGICGLAAVMLCVPGFCMRLQPVARAVDNEQNSAHKAGDQLAAGQRPHSLLFGTALVVVGLGWVWAIVVSVPKVPWQLVAYGRRLPITVGHGMNLFMAEGLNESVAVTEMSNGVRNFHVSGKIEASTDLHDMRLQRMLGHLPALLHPEPRTVLVVGCGAGVTAGSFTVHPSVRRVVLCVIERLIPPRWWQSTLRRRITGWCTTLASKLSMTTRGTSS
jgi:spermidine synthase